jgi:predicted hydrolase (HD superfamily)
MHAIKPYGDAKVQLHSFLTLASEVSGLLHALADLHPGKATLVTNKYL